MAQLVYACIASLDGYVNDADGGFEWAAPDPEVHQFVNDRERAIGTYLYGRRMYETMVFWDDAEALPGSSPETLDYAALWRAADKIVYSTTLPAVTSARTRLERVFDADAVRALKGSAQRDISVGGPGLAGSALAAGLVDEVELYVVPEVVGGGTRWLPGGLRLSLALESEHRFAGGVAHLRYRVADR